MLCLIGVGLLVVAAYALGTFPQLRARDSAQPPCERLPTRTAVADAVAAHEALVTRMKGVGAGVRVDVITACQGPPDGALVSVTYATDSERNALDAILQEESFGVPVEVVSG